jgi:hypothetical protein
VEDVPAVLKTFGVGFNLSAGKFTENLGIPGVNHGKALQS